MNRANRVLPADPLAIEEAARILRAGGLVAFPTETVYGLGADATYPEAVASIFEAKGRPANNPLIVHAESIESLQSVVSEWPETASILADRFWPGPLTFVLPRSALIPDVVTAGQPTVGVRIPDSEVALALLRQTGRPIAAPSANRSTGVSPTTAEHVLKDLGGRIDLILDGGRTPFGIESTVIDLTCNPPQVLRPGAITASMISRVLDLEVTGAPHPSEHGPLTSPGRLAVHYSPKARLIVVDQLLTIPYKDTCKVGLIVPGHTIQVDVNVYTDYVHWDDPTYAARELYATLHRWDEAGFDRIEVILPPNDDRWSAIHDRLWRASRRWAVDDHSKSLR